MRKVVPHAGTWIEIMMWKTLAILQKVVPHAGTWIEILLSEYTYIHTHVVPHAGTWIEMDMLMRFCDKLLGRSPRGNVD